MRQLAAGGRLGEDFGILVDGRVTKSILSVEEVRVIASAISNPALFLRHPTALVASQAVQYGLGNMISIITGMQGATVRPFYEVEEAKAWLRQSATQRP
jgi:hypothetical protein